MRTVCLVAAAFGVMVLLALSAHAAPTVLAIPSNSNVDVYGPVIFEPSRPDDLDWGSPHKAVPVPVNQAWPTLAGATWISTAATIEDPTHDSWRMFHVTFQLPAGAQNVSGFVHANSDDAEAVYLNGEYIGSYGSVFGPVGDSVYSPAIRDYAITPQTGENDIDIIVRNYAATVPDPEDGNPTGVVFMVNVTYDAGVMLSVHSTPITGVSVTGSPSGATDYDAPILAGAAVSLRAAAMATGNYAFLRWQKNGASQSYGNTRLSFKATTDTTAMAQYKWFRYLKIIGHTSIYGGTRSAYACRLYCRDGTSYVITRYTKWAENSAYAKINSAGLLTTSRVSSNKRCRIAANYAGKTYYLYVWIKRR